MTTQLEPAPKKADKQAKLPVPVRVARITAASAAVVAVITAAGTVVGIWLQSRGASPDTAKTPGAVTPDPPPSSAPSATTIPAKILQPTDNGLADNCITVKGTATPLRGPQTYWLLVRRLPPPLDQLPSFPWKGRIMDSGEGPPRYAGYQGHS